MSRRSRAEARAGAHALPRKYTKAFTEKAREPHNVGIYTGLFCPIRLHTRICASYGEASHSTKVFSTSGKIPGRIPGKRGFFGEIFPGFFLDGYIPGTIPGKMPRFQSATVVRSSWDTYQLFAVARELASHLRLKPQQQFDRGCGRAAVGRKAAQHRHGADVEEHEIAHIVLIEGWVYSASIPPLLLGNRSRASCVCETFPFRAGRNNAKRSRGCVRCASERRVSGNDDSAMESHILAEKDPTARILLRGLSFLVKTTLCTVCAQTVISTEPIVSVLVERLAMLPLTKSFCRRTAMSHLKKPTLLSLSIFVLVLVALFLRTGLAQATSLRDSGTWRGRLESESQHEQ